MFDSSMCLRKHVQSINYRIIAFYIINIYCKRIINKINRKCITIRKIFRMMYHLSLLIFQLFYFLYTFSLPEEKFQSYRNLLNPIKIRKQREKNRNWDFPKDICFYVAYTRVEKKGRYLFQIP